MRHLIFHIEKQSKEGSLKLLIVAVLQDFCEALGKLKYTPVHQTLNTETQR